MRNGSEAYEAICDYGNGVAAAGCIEGIRSADPNGAVTVVSAERHPVYCRPLISYYLEGKTDIERMRYRDAGFYEQNGCRVLYGRSAVRLDAAAKTVELDDGTILPYDSICVAAGSSPFLPARWRAWRRSKRHSPL